MRAGNHAGSDWSRASLKRRGFAFLCLLPRFRESLSGRGARSGFKHGRSPVLRLGRVRIKKLDAYEGAEYLRQRQPINAAPDQQPVQAWVYVIHPLCRARLSRTVWTAVLPQSGDLKNLTQTTAWMQEVEQCKEQLPRREGAER